MSQLRQEILDDLRDYLRKWSHIAYDAEIDQDWPVDALKLDPEQEGRMIIYLEDTWKIHFEDMVRYKGETPLDLHTISDLVTIIIKLMNDG